MRRHDVLLHHPYDSFATSVQRFIEQAAADPHVLAIKQTLYRTSGDSPIIDALIDAAEAGKQVLVIVEIKARFDEQANIRWARKLEQAGCHVVYGLVGLKTHCKLAMVVRDEPDGIRRYTHIGTGNYNPKTARLYEDLGLLTTDEAIGEDVAHLFNNLSGLSRATRRTTSCWSPRTRVRDGLVDQIHREIAHHQAGRAGRDPDQGQLDRRRGASSTRSTSPRRPACRSSCWSAASARCAPACPACRRRSRCARSSAASSSTAGSSGSTTAASPAAWIGSADMMHRNLDRRVEVLVRLPRASNVVARSARCSTWPSTPDTTAWELDARRRRGTATRASATCRRS